ncbi:hypothetical protein MN116_006006 [Schistosoma mekongi]|uniref:C2 DOCK-type domain-containing protein n=1 Tax=Schistosoma mekongi TaxID=38744 RepID=A0AAE2D429_SCHME|nr:hypothetical protein MN116_006006 [Schistosoma mekongi]
MSFNRIKINDTILCVNLKRNQAFNPSPVPELLQSSPPSVQQCVSSYSSTIQCFRIYDDERLRNKYSSLHISNINDFMCNKTLPHEKLLEGQPDENSKNNSQQAHRLHLLGFLGDLVATRSTSILGVRELLEWKDVIEIRQLSPGSKWPSEPLSLTKCQPNTTLYLLSEFLQLQLDDGDIEPIFGSAFIYDVHSRLKLTETFHFDTNSSKLMNLFTGSMTNQQLAYRDASSLAQTCMFRISSRYNLFNTSGPNNSTLKSHLKSPSYDGSSEKMTVNSGVSANDCELNRSDDYGLEDILLLASEWSEKQAFGSSKTPCCKGGLFLVIRVEKVLQQGDVNDIIEGYNKDEKNKDKLKTTINWCCQRLSRYRMPLVWTAVDLTPYIIDIHNKCTQLQNDDISCIKTPESINTNKQYVEPHKRNPGSGSSIRSRSVDPSLHNPKESYNGNLCDSLSSVGVSNNSPERSLKKVKYDWIKGIVTNYQEKRFHQSLSNNSKVNEQLDSMYFLPIELVINNFFRQDQDRINDDELFRHVNEIHRQTLCNYRPNSSGSGFNGTSVNSHTVVSNNSNNSDNSSLNFSNFSLNFTSTFSPTSSSVRRFKTISNVSLHLRLHLATPQTLVKLLKSVDLNIGKCSTSLEKNELNIQSKVLLNPECLPYTGSMFQQFNDFSVNKVSSNSTMFSYIPNLIREVLELPSPDLMVPFTSYRNLLYVYPRSVSLPSSKHASSRNITVRVQFMYSDSTVTKVLPAIYGKSNSPRFISDSFTTVLYHNRSPEFFDEIKIQLPAKLEESHYLLFTFYHVICQTKKLESSTPLETVIGYSWLPLLEQGCLKDRAVNLLVSVDKPSPALAMVRPDIKSISEKFCMDACKWVDGHRELFNVSTTVVSSVYMQDALLECLLSACHVDRISCTIESFSSRSTVRQLFSYVHKARLHQLIAFFVPILDGLLRLLLSCIIHTISIKMNTKSNNSSMEINRPCVIALELLIVFLNRITRNFPHLNDRHGRNQLLVSYLTGPHFMTIEAVLGHYFSGHPLFGVPVVSDLANADQIDKSLLANIILTELVRIYLLRTKHIDTQNSQNFFESLWFLLELFINLLAQDWHLTMETNEPTIILPLSENPCFLEDLSAFNSCLTEYMMRYGCSQETEKSEDSAHWEAYRLWNQIFSFFLYDLLSLLPIGYVFSEIKNYWNKIEQLLSDAELNQILSHKLLKYFKLDLLQIICSHKAFYLMNIAANNDSLPVNCEQLLLRYQQVSLCQSDQAKSDKKSKYIPLATIEPEFYGTEDNQLHQSDYSCEKSFDVNSVNISNNHFLISLVICELITALKSENSDLQSRTVDLLWNILFNNEVDLEQEISEETSSPHLISNISQLTYFYSPILNITCDFLPCLVKTWHLNKSRPNQSINNELHKLKQQFPNTVTADRLVPNQQNDISSTGRASGRMRRIRRYTKNTKFSESISDCNSFTKEPEKPHLPIFSEDSFVNAILNSQLDSTKPMKYSTLKRLLLIIIWILKYIPTSLYYQWLQQASAKERSQLVLLIYLITDIFETMLYDNDLFNKDDFPPTDTKNHLDCSINKNESQSGSDQNTSLLKFSNGHNSSFDRPHKQMPQEQSIKLKSPSIDHALFSRQYVHLNNTYSSQQHCPRPNLLKLKTKFTRSNSFSLGSSSSKIDLYDSCQGVHFQRNILVSNDVTLIICNSLDSMIEGLWQLDDELGQPGLNLFTLYNYSFKCILPYKKSDNVNNHNNTFTNQSLISCIIRVILYVLGLCQCVTSYQRILLSLKRIISRFPSFLFEDNPEFCSVLCYHLLRLCTEKDSTVRDVAMDTLYFLMKTYYTLTKSLSFVKVHLYLIFSSFFIKLVNGMTASVNSVNKHSNKINSENIHSITSSTKLVKPYIIDSLHYLKHLTLSDVDSNIPTPFNSKHDETVFNSEIYIEPFNLTPPSSVNNYDDGYNTASGITVTPSTTGAETTVPTVPFMSNIPNSNFTLQINQLVDNLIHILNDAICLQDTIHIVHTRQQDQSNICQKQVANEDTLLLIDLLHSISHRNRASPELRLYWVLQIAEKHYELSQFAEASQCLAHCAAIVAEHMINRGCSPPGLSPTGCADIADAVQNLNILEESCACGFPNTSVFDNFSCSTPIILEDLSSIMPLDVSWHFTLPGFMALLSWTAESFAKAGFYEIVPCLYSRLVSLLQSSRDYGRLAEIHGRIRDAYTVLDKTRNTKRMFNSYFRVGFHGSLFGELSGRDFIYKEAPFTKLAEITHRLQTFYGDKFGQDRVVVIKDSNIVDEKQLDSDKGYLQITFVEPYLEDFELRRRTTEFHCNYGLKRFVHSLPFTIDGQTHGSLSTQYKRKCILTTSRCFPYMKTRLLVVSTESHIVTPIEVALEDVTRRVEQLDRVLATHPPDVKYLQMILQGCIGTVVNQGPIEMATTFLGHEKNKPLKSLLPDKNNSSTTLDSITYEDIQNRLRITFQQFLIKFHQLVINVKRLLDPLIVIPKSTVINGSTIMKQHFESVLKTTK